MSPVWAFKASPHVLIEDIDSLLACYSGLTGQTHLLDAFPAEILRLLAGEPKTAQQINQELIAMVGEGDQLDSIQTVIREFRKLQLLDSWPL